MPKHNPIYTDRFDQVLRLLVDEYGENKWAEITRQMKNIYQINIPNKAMVQARWRALNPNIDREEFNQEDMIEHWHICVKSQCHWDSVKAEYKERGQVRDKCYLSQKFYQFFTHQFYKLYHQYFKPSKENQQITQMKIDQMRDTTKKRILELNAKNQFDYTDMCAQEMIASCQNLINILTYFISNFRREPKLIIEQIKGLITPEKLSKVMTNIFTMDIVVLISCNELKASDDLKRLLKMDEKLRYKFKKPTTIKKWDEALQNPSSPDFSEEEQSVIQGQLNLNRYSDGISFNRADMDEIKSSVLFKLCNPEQNQTFYDWYNEAKVEKALIKTDYLVDVIEDGYIKNHRKQMHPNGKIAIVARKQLKELEKKTKLIENTNYDEQIKTVRGKIKLEKEVFPGCYTKFFNKEDEPDTKQDDVLENFLKIQNPDGIYQYITNHRNNLGY